MDRFCVHTDFTFTRPTVHVFDLDDLMAPSTVGADRAYDTCDFVWDQRALGLTLPMAPERARSA